MTIDCCGEILELLPEKAIYWPAAGILLLADLHLGKGAHFRRNGMAVPQGVEDDNFTRLQQLLETHEPERVIFLGDLFHSEENSTVITFALFLSTHPEVRFELVMGNHDILPAALYEHSVLIIHRPPLLIAPFVLTHYPMEEVPDEQYNLYGHLHPGVALRGPGRDRLSLPCFHFASRQAVLPAFGAFTGLSLVQPATADRVYVLAEGSILAVP